MRCTGLLFYRLTHKWYLYARMYGWVDFETHHTGCSLLRFTLSAEPRASRNLHNAIAGCGEMKQSVKKNGGHTVEESSQPWQNTTSLKSHHNNNENMLINANVILITSAHKYHTIGNCQLFPRHVPKTWFEMRLVLGGVLIWQAEVQLLLSLVVFITLCWQLQNSWSPQDNGRIPGNVLLMSTHTGFNDKSLPACYSTRTVKRLLSHGAPTLRKWLRRSRQGQKQVCFKQEHS